MQHVSYHVREAVKNPDSGHQVQVNLAHQLLLLFGFLFERRGRKFDVGIVGVYGFLALDNILLDICSREVAECLSLVLPEGTVWMVWSHSAKEVLGTEPKCLEDVDFGGVNR
jgi:hypothetical protein